MVGRVTIAGAYNRAAMGWRGTAGESTMDDRLFVLMVAVLNEANAELVELARQLNDGSFLNSWEECRRRVYAKIWEAR